MIVADDILFEYISAKHRVSYVEFQFNLAKSYAKRFQSIADDVATLSCSRCLSIHKSGAQDDSPHTCQDRHKSMGDMYLFFEKHIKFFLNIVNQDEVTSHFEQEFVRVTGNQTTAIPDFFKRWDCRRLLFDLKHFIHWICKACVTDHSDPDLVSEMHRLHKKHLKILKKTESKVFE